MKISAFYKKYSNIAVFLFISYLPLHAQDVCFVNNYRFNLPYKFGYTITKQNENTILLLYANFFNQHINADPQYVFYKFNLDEKNADSIQINFKHKNTKKIFSPITDFCFQQDKLFCLAYSHLIIFTLKDNFFGIRKIIKLPFKATKFFILNDDTFVFSDVYGTSSEDKYIAFVLWFDLKKERIIKKENVTVDGICFSMLHGTRSAHSRLFSTISSITSYKIYVFNNVTMELLDTLTIEDSKFSENEKFYFNYKEKSDFGFLRSKQKNSSLIRHIKFLDDTLLIVVKKYPNSDSLNKGYFDLWSIGKNGGNLLAKNLECRLNFGQDTCENLNRKTIPFSVLNIDNIFYGKNNLYYYLCHWIDIEKYIDKPKSLLIKRINSGSEFSGFGLREYYICADKNSE